MSDIKTGDSPDNKKPVCPALSADKKHSCEFKVYRPVDAKTCVNVLAMSLWVGDPAYAEVMKKSLPFWFNYFPRVKKKLHWRIRMYVDQLSWKLLQDSFPPLNNLPDHLEIFMYLCPVAVPMPSAATGTMPSSATSTMPSAATSHTNTFGSLMRFHALADTGLERVVLRNFEQLTSPEELYYIEHIRKDQTKSILAGMYYLPQDYTTNQADFSAYDIDGWFLPSFLAGAVYWVRPSLQAPMPWSFQDFLCEASRCDPVDFKYGIDEIVLKLLSLRAKKEHSDRIEVKRLHYPDEWLYRLNLSKEEMGDIIENLPAHQAVKRYYLDEIVSGLDNRVKWFTSDYPSPYPTVPSLEDCREGPSLTSPDLRTYIIEWYSKKKKMQRRKPKHIHEKLMLTVHKDDILATQPKNLDFPAHVLSEMKTDPPFVLLLGTDPEHHIDLFVHYVQQVHSQFRPSVQLEQFSDVRNNPWFIQNMDLITIPTKGSVASLNVLHRPGWKGNKSWLSTYCFAQAVRARYADKILQMQKDDDDEFGPVGLPTICEVYLTVEWKIKGTQETKFHEILRTATFEATLNTPWQYAMEEKSKNRLLEGQLKQAPLQHPSRYVIEQKSKKRSLEERESTNPQVTEKKQRLKGGVFLPREMEHRTLTNFLPRMRSIDPNAVQSVYQWNHLFYDTTFPLVHGHWGHPDHARLAGSSKTEHGVTLGEYQQLLQYAHDNNDPLLQGLQLKKYAIRQGGQLYIVDAKSAI